VKPPKAVGAIAEAFENTTWIAVSPGARPRAHIPLPGSKYGFVET